MFLSTSTSSAMKRRTLQPGAFISCPSYHLHALRLFAGHMSMDGWHAMVCMLPAETRPQKMRSKKYDGVWAVSEYAERFCMCRQVNFNNANVNVGLPVFTIHGNHDDPSGDQNLSAVDVLSSCNLVNYFGRVVSPFHCHILSLSSRACTMQECCMHCCMQTASVLQAAGMPNQAVFFMHSCIILGFAAETWWLRRGEVQSEPSPDPEGGCHCFAIPTCMYSMCSFAFSRLCL